MEEEVMPNGRDNSNGNNNHGNNGGNPSDPTARGDNSNSPANGSNELYNGTNRDEDRGDNGGIAIPNGDDTGIHIIRQGNGGTNLDETGISPDEGSGGSPKRRGRPRKSASDRTDPSPGGSQASEGRRIPKANTREVEFGIPEEADIPPEEIEEKPTRQPKVRNSTVYAKAWEVAFQVPIMSGMGDHWAISSQEARILGDATDAVLTQTVDKKTAAKVAKTMTKYVPLFTLATALYTTVYPRALVNIEEYKERKRIHAAQELDKNQTSPKGYGIGARRDGGASADGETYHIPTWDNYKPNG